MKTTEEILTRFNKELEPYFFFPLKISKYPTWINNKVSEGIEIRPNEVLTFKVEMGERNYKAETQAITKKALNEVFYKKEEPQKVPESKTMNLPEVKGSETVGIIPEYFTEELMNKWKALSGLRRLLDVQHTPKHQVYEVEVGKEGGRPIMASYVKANYMITEANYVFLFDWNYEVLEVSVSQTGVSVRGYFIGTLDGKTMKKSSVGYQELNKKMDVQQATKSALTDAIKKALSYMGFNRDVYGGEI